MNDALGDRMKMYETAEAGRRLLPGLPVVARIDGRAFRTFTRGMRRPFDPDCAAAIIDAARCLLEQTQACIAYAQSDEITLTWHAADLKSQIWFDGRIHKMVSQLAAQATLHFYRAIMQRLPEFAHRLPTFDARVWSVPNRSEAANVFVWREWDATKNSISMAASEFYTDEELRGMNGSQKQEMLFRRGINWNDYPTHFKRGTYLQRRTTTRGFSREELQALPPLHAAHADPELEVQRSEIVTLELPPITQVGNREALIFEAAPPEFSSSARAD